MHVSNSHCHKRLWSALTDAALANSRRYLALGKPDIHLNDVSPTTTTRPAEKKNQKNCSNCFASNGAGLPIAQDKMYQSIGQAVSRGEKPVKATMESLGASICNLRSHERVTPAGLLRACDEVLAQALGRIVSSYGSCPYIVSHRGLHIHFRFLEVCVPGRCIEPRSRLHRAWCKMRSRRMK